MNYLEIYPELKKVKWFDLVKPGRCRIIMETLLPLPFLMLSLYALYLGLIPLAFTGAFFFFLAGLRLSHNAQHYIVGCSKTGCQWIMYLLSIFMMNAMHAVQVTHLHHHRHCLNEKDVEGHCAKMNFFEAILYGPLFTINMHKNAWKLGNDTQRKWIILEVISEIFFLTFCFLSGQPFLKAFVFLMLFANCLTAFFCVWIVHYKCDGLKRISRTMRNRWVNKITMNMLLHVEHHLFPQVPTYNLEELAQRIDKEAKTFRENLVF